MSIDLEAFISASINNNKGESWQALAKEKEKIDQARGKSS
jgi:hypothetical protein